MNAANIYQRETSPRLPPSDRLSFLDNIRAVAIIMVVAYHTMGYCVPLPPPYSELLTFIVYIISVPVFFLADGYIFARSAARSSGFDYAGYIRKSSMRLLVTWVIFTLLYTLARYSFELAGLLKEKLVIGHSLPEVALMAYGSTYAPQMYFLLSLFLIRLCSPIVRKVVRCNTPLLVPMLFLVYVVLYQSTEGRLAVHLKYTAGQEPIWHAFWGMQYYLLGIACFKVSEVLDLRRLFLPVLVLFVIAVIAKDNLGVFEFSVLQYLYLLSMFLFFVFFQNQFQFLGRLGSLTMGIYLIHAPVILKGVSLVMNRFIGNPLASFASILSATLLITIAVVMLINSIPHGSLLFGMPYQRKTDTKSIGN